MNVVEEKVVDHLISLAARNVLLVLFLEANS